MSLRYLLIFFYIFAIIKLQSLKKFEKINARENKSKTNEG